MITLLILTIQSCKTISSDNRYILSPCPSRPLISKEPSAYIDKDTLQNLQDVFVSWKNQGNLTEEQIKIIKAYSEYNTLLFDWQKWSTKTIHDQDMVLQFWEVWAEEVQKTTHAKIAN